MTFDQRDLVPVECYECGWGVRVMPSQTERVLEAHHCPPKPSEAPCEGNCSSCECRSTDELTIIQYESGVHRTSTEGKIDYSLVDLEMLKRWAAHMTKGAETHGRENWRKAHTEEDWQRFKSSAFRHFIQWFSGETDEDHAAAVLFNISGAEMVKARLQPKWDEDDAGSYR